MTDTTGSPAERASGILGKGDRAASNVYVAEEKRHRELIDVLEAIAVELRTIAERTGQGTPK